MIRRVPAALGWLLAVFHVWLFSADAVSGELAQPRVALRWAAAILVFAGFVALRRAGFSIFKGRRAVALWVLVVLLHAPAIAERVNDAGPALPEVVTLLTRTSTAAGAVVLVFLVAALAAHRRDPRGFASWRLPLVIVCRAWLVPAQTALAPRPPPTA